MKNSELANLFAKGNTEGTGSNMHIEGDAIYSYGEHFPLAVRLSNRKYLVNKDSYSPTTRKHQSYVSTALSSKETMYADTKTLIEAIRIGAKDLVVTKEIVNPDTFSGMQEVLIQFLKEKGFGRRAHTRSKKFINEMKKLAILENA